MLKVADSAMPNLSVIHRMHLKEQFNIDVDKLAFELAIII